MSLFYAMVIDFPLVMLDSIVALGMRSLAASSKSPGA